MCFLVSACLQVPLPFIDSDCQLHQPGTRSAPYPDVHTHTESIWGSHLSGENVQEKKALLESASVWSSEMVFELQETFPSTNLLFFLGVFNLLAMWPQASCLRSLGFSFFSSKMGVIAFIEAPRKKVGLYSRC